MWTAYTPGPLDHGVAGMTAWSSLVARAHGLEQHRRVGVDRVDAGGERLVEGVEQVLVEDHRLVEGLVPEDGGVAHDVRGDLLDGA